MKQLAASGLSDGAVRANEPQLKSQRLRHGKSKGMSAPGDQHDVHAGLMCGAQCVQVCLSDLVIGVEQSPVNINGEQANAGSHYTDSSILLCSRCLRISFPVASPQSWLRYAEKQ